MRNAEEHGQQVALVKWAYMTRVPPASDVREGAKVGHYLFAIPNGGQRTKAGGARLKAEGVKAGVFDLFLPLRRIGAAGLWVEMKSRTGRLSVAQEDWLLMMDQAGYRTAVCRNWTEAVTAICSYLEMPDPLARMRD